jgi:Phage integrase, N-terminal SAM-like domain
MLVQRVLMPVSSLESWTVLGDAGGPVGPIERYLAYLAEIERSSNTVKAYAHDLKDWFEFLVVRGLDWREVRLEDLGEFVAWLRLPPTGRAGGVALQPWLSTTAPPSRSTGSCRQSTICTRSAPGTGSTSATWLPSCSLRGGARDGSRSFTT